jgi:hypothetical protein
MIGFIAFYFTHRLTTLFIVTYTLVPTATISLPLLVTGFNGGRLTSSGGFQTLLGFSYQLLTATALKD